MLPHAWAHVDDLTILENSTHLRKFQTNIEFAWMRIKMVKSKSTTIVKGKLSGGPTDQQVDHFRYDAVDGLEIIDQLINAIWAPSAPHVSTNKDGKTGETDQLLCQKRWLGFPRCLIWQRTLLYQEYKYNNVGLEILLIDSSDPMLAQTVPILATWRKSNPLEAWPGGLNISLDQGHRDAGVWFGRYESRWQCQGAQKLLLEQSKASRWQRREWKGGGPLTPFQQCYLVHFKFGKYYSLLGRDHSQFPCYGKHVAPHHLSSSSKTNTDVGGLPFHVNLDVMQMTVTKSWSLMGNYIILYLKRICMTYWLVIT